MNFSGISEKASRKKMSEEEWATRMAVLEEAVFEISKSLVKFEEHVEAQTKIVEKLGEEMKKANQLRDRDIARNRKGWF